MFDLFSRHFCPKRHTFGESRVTRSLEHSVVKVLAHDITLLSPGFEPATFPTQSKDPSPMRHTPISSLLYLKPVFIGPRAPELGNIFQVEVPMST